MTRGEHIYNYPLFSLKRIPSFIKYSVRTAKKIDVSRWLAILIDMIWCNLRYGAIDSRDYLLFDFYKKNARGRKSYFTKRKYFRLIKSFDKDVFLHFIKKENQYREYSEFVNRKWMVIDETTTWDNLCDFINGCDEIILKPDSSDCGTGVFKFSRNDSLERLRIIFDNRAKESYLAEEAVVNCKELDSLNPYSLNTVRVTYILRRDSRPLIFSVMLRCGALENVVADNWGSGGILMNVDIRKGIVKQPGLDESGNAYLYHPCTNTKIVGFEIPRFHEMMEFSKKIARHNQNIVYGGLDIAITPTGFKLIEINFPPAYLGYQVFGEGALEYLEMIGK